MLVRDLHYQLRTQRLPRQVLALAPAARASGHAPPFSSCFSPMLRPPAPGMVYQRVLSIRFKKLRQLHALLLREARAYAHMLQRAPLVEKTQQERPDQALAFFM